MLTTRASSVERPDARRTDGQGIGPVRPPAPGRSLAECFPEVAATWDCDANGELAPSDIAAKSNVVVGWRCGSGHTWRESVAQRTDAANWKGGNRAACRFCTGYYVEVAFSCGHREIAVSDFRADPSRLCSACWAEVQAKRRSEYEARHRAYDENKDEIKARVREDASEQVDRLWAEFGLERLPRYLHARARKELISKLTFHLIGERAFGKPALEKVEACLSELSSLASGEVVDDPGRPLDLFGLGWWAPSLRTEVAPWAPEEPETLSLIEGTARDALALRFEEGSDLFIRARIMRAYEEVAQRSDWTYLITEALSELARKQGWRRYRELHVPLPDARAHGRLDLVCFRPGCPDLAIEVDSGASRRSQTKLEFVRDRGALPIWIRWHGGRTAQLPGVHLIDLTSLTAALL